MENEKQRDWSEILEEYENSGLSRKKYAEQKGLSVHTLNYYIRKKQKTSIPEKSGASGFVQIPVKSGFSEKSLPEITMTFDAKTLTIKVNFGS